MIEIFKIYSICETDLVKEISFHSGISHLSISHLVEWSEIYYSEFDAIAVIKKHFELDPDCEENLIVL